MPDGAKRSYDFPLEGFCFSLPYVVLFPSRSCWVLSLFLLSVFFVLPLLCFCLFSLCFFQEDFVCFWLCMHVVFPSWLSLSCVCVSTSCESGIMFEYGCLSHCCHFFPRECSSMFLYFVLLSYFLLRMFPVVISMSLFSMLSIIFFLAWLVHVFVYVMLTHGSFFRAITSLTIPLQDNTLEPATSGLGVIAQTCSAPWL